jgi:L-seryl-tRNA(Ser) seleniumtransferase
VVDTEAVAGGGSLPGLTIPSCGLSVDVTDADAALAHLRTLGIVARLDAGAIVCDLRTVDPSDDPRLAAALASIAP